MPPWWHPLGPGPFAPQPGESWWDLPCPARGSGLTHAHWNRCNPKKVHPKDPTGNEGNQHSAATCCHCEIDEEQARMIDIAIASGGIIEPEVRHVTERPMADHAYMPTIVGRCARAKCGRLAEEHPTYRQAEPEECPIDHASLTSKLQTTYAGLEWSFCPQCGRQVETKMASGQPAGHPEGAGRGMLTNRQYDRLRHVAANERFQAWLDTGHDDRDRT